MYCCDEQSEARLHVVLFCFACPKILVIEDLFFFGREIRGMGGNVGSQGQGSVGDAFFFARGEA